MNATTQRVALRVVLTIDVDAATRVLAEFSAPDVPTLVENEVQSHLDSLDYVVDLSIERLNETR
jgi:hypothetical protein